MIVIGNKIYRTESPNYHEVYSEQEIIASGTLDECSDQSGLKKSTLKYYTTPGYKSRIKREPNMTYVNKKSAVRNEIKIVAVYKGDNFITSGTPVEVSETLDVELETIAQWLSRDTDIYGYTVVELEGD